MSSDESVGSYESTDEEEEMGMKRKKGRSRPRRPLSAFFLYSKANRSRVREENPEAPFGQVARILSSEFKALPESEKAKWDNLAEKDKVRYDQEMQSHVPPSENSASHKHKKDPNAPKRYQSAFFLFSFDVRPRLREEYPDASFGDIARITSDEFHVLSPSERARYDDLAAKDKERYQREMAAYKSGH